MNDATGLVETVLKDSAERDQIISGPAQRAWLFLRRHARPILYSWAVIILLAMSFQVVCILLLLRRSQGWAQYWVSFGRDFATSPAAAGLCAVIAAWIAASQLSKQLKHSREKASDEAWWQQFEWVTDRIISSGQKGEKDDTRLPSSLAFDLMTSLSGSAAASFQEDAVAGILNHYLKEFIKPRERTQEQDEAPTSDGPLKDTSDGPTIDAAGAKSLRNLMEVLPESSRAPARSALRAFEYQEYEQEVLKALRHRFGDAVQTGQKAIFGADAVIEVGSRRIAIEVKHFIAGARTFEMAGAQLQQVMGVENATDGAIVTPPTSLNTGFQGLQHLARNGIHLIEWEPSRSSYALYDRITSIFGDNQA